MPLNLSIEYSHTSAKLTVEGLPDRSLNHDDSQIGIISIWKLKLIGLSELEGKLPHLKSLMNVVLTYARYCVSDVRRSIGDSIGPVRIEPYNNKHKLILISSQEGINPLNLLIDDAELSDLVRCLDDLRSDKRIQIDWEVNEDIPLKKFELDKNRSIYNSLGIPLIGLLITTGVSLMFLFIPFHDSQKVIIKSPINNLEEQPKVIDSLTN